MAERYIKLEGNIYFDSKEKAIVKSMGSRFVFLRHDRRTKDAPVAQEKRKYNKTNKNFMPLGGNLFFDKITKQLYRKTGENLVLYSKDRRKESKPVTKDRRTSR
ncbi:MAG: hypothetical protein ACLFP1_02460 [Candidatus Goldiibacteriota bacterium]